MPTVILNPSSFAGIEGMPRDFTVDATGALRTVSSPATSSIATTDTSGTIAAASNVVALPLNAARQLLVISNTGTNPMVLRFGAVASATAGHLIAAGASLVLDAKCPTGSVNLFSTAGTTYTVTTG